MAVSLRRCWRGARRRFFAAERAVVVVLPLVLRESSSACGLVLRFVGSFDKINGCEKVDCGFDEGETKIVAVRLEEEEISRGEQPSSREEKEEPIRYEPFRSAVCRLFFVKDEILLRPETMGGGGVARDHEEGGGHGKSERTGENSPKVDSVVVVDNVARARNDDGDTGSQKQPGSDEQVGCEVPRHARRASGRLDLVVGVSGFEDDSGSFLFAAEGSDEFDRTRTEQQSGRCEHPERQRSKIYKEFVCDAQCEDKRS